MSDMNRDDWDAGHVAGCNVGYEKGRADAEREAADEIDRLRRRDEELKARNAFETAAMEKKFECDQHYVDAVSELTERKAWSKSAIAAIIAEKTREIERLRKIEAAAREASSTWKRYVTIDHMIRTNLPVGVIDAHKELRKALQEPTP